MTPDWDRGDDCERALGQAAVLYSNAYHALSAEIEHCPLYTGTV